jgi:REP element-mobilizing transposase RayT
MEIYAWVLMPNHFHLLCKTNNLPLASIMRRLLTGYQRLLVNLRGNGRARRMCCLFFNRSGNSRKNYLQYVKEGIDQGRRPELVGGGLIRSMI